jgi:cytoskeletal protein RodZ
VKLLNQAQEEQLKEIVAQLKQVRQEKSMRIEEVAAHTRIRPVLLQALEEERFEELPEAVYVKGFIRHYGDAVGLDGSALSQTFATAFSSPEPENHYENHENNEKINKKSNFRIPPLVIPYGILLAVASLGLFYVLTPRPKTESVGVAQYSASDTKHKTSSQQSSKLSSSKQNSASAPKSKTILPVASTPTPTASPTTNANSNVEVTLALQDKSWLRVKVDGKTAFEGVLNKGDRKTWTAQKELAIRSGNAGAVLFSTNNQPPQPLGPVDSVKNVIITPGKISSQ